MSLYVTVCIMHNDKSLNISEGMSDLPSPALHMLFKNVYLNLGFVSKCVLFVTCQGCGSCS